MVGVFVEVDYSVIERYCRNSQFPGFSCVSRSHVLAMREEEEDVAARCLVGSLGLRLATSTSLRTCACPHPANITSFVGATTEHFIQSFEGWMVVIYRRYHFHVDSTFAGGSIQENRFRSSPFLIEQQTTL